MKHQEYQVLQDEIFKLSLLDETDENGLNNSVYIAVTRVLEVLDQRMDAPVPSIFSHNRDSIILLSPETPDSKERVYLSITATQVSTLVSKPETVSHPEHFFLDDFLFLVKKV